MSRPPDPTRVLLVGMMGCGKSTVGEALSRHTGWPHLDNDELLHRATGEQTRSYQAAHGEQALRAAESAALAEALALDPPVIADVAAGVVTDAADRARLRTGGYVVWLRARLDTLVQRVAGTDRPWLQGDPAAVMRRLADGRDPLYAEVATLTVDVDGRSGDEVAGVILDALQDAGRSGGDGDGTPRAAR